MEPCCNREVSKPRSGDAVSRETTASIASLNEAWLHTLDECAIDMPFSQIILPMMRNSFFAGAIYAVLLIQKVMAIALVPISPALPPNSRSLDPHSLPDAIAICRLGGKMNRENPAEASICAADNDSIGSTGAMPLTAQVFNARSSQLVPTEIPFIGIAHKITGMRNGR